MKRNAVRSLLRSRYERRRVELDLLFDTRTSICQPFADNSPKSADHPLAIVYSEHNPLIVPKIEFSKITFQMMFAYVLVHAIDAALQNREIAFDGIRVCITPNIFVRVPSGVWFSPSISFLL
jgi:hypothetical protein